MVQEQLPPIEENSARPPFSNPVFERISLQISHKHFPDFNPPIGIILYTMNLNSIPSQIIIVFPTLYCHFPALQLQAGDLHAFFLFRPMHLL